MDKKTETLLSVAAAIDSLCGKIATADHCGDWTPVADLMRNGFLASLRDEVDNAIGGGDDE